MRWERDFSSLWFGRLVIDKVKARSGRNVPGEYYLKIG